MIGQFEVNFKEALKAYRRTLTKSQRKKRPSIKWLYPFAQEKRYYSLLLETVKKPLVNYVNQYLIENLPGWIEQKKVIDVTEWKKIKNNPEKTYIPDNRKDSWIDDMERFIINLRGKSEKITGETKSAEDSAWKILSIIAAAVFIFNKKQFQKSTKSVLGFNYESSDPWWNDLYKSWSAENYNLIKGLSDEYIKKINTIAWDGFRNGLSNREITKQIQELNGEIFGPRYKINPKTGRRIKVQSRAELLARDQVGKLNGELTKRRMQDIGNDVYEWNIASDERVRGRPGGRYPKAIPSHWIMQGKLCKWSDNSVYAEKPDNGKIIWILRTGKMPIAIPGSEIQCRCTGTVYWDIMLNDIDREIF